MKSNHERKEENYRLPATNSKIRNGVKVRLEHFGITKDFVTKGVQTIQSDPDVSGSYKILSQEQQFV